MSFKDYYNQEEEFLDEEQESKDSIDNFISIDEIEDLTQIASQFILAEESTESISENKSDDKDETEPTEETTPEEITVESNEEQPTLGVDTGGQISLFGDTAVVNPPTSKSKPKMAENPKVVEKPKTVATSTAGKTTPKKNKVDPEKFEVTSEWTLHYARESFNVSDFFDPMPAKVTLEELRQRMELQMLEFSKKRTRWDVEEDNKRLFPYAMGEDKGGCL